MHPVAGTPAAPTSIAESVPRVATPAHRVCTLEALQKARPDTLRSFFRKHRCYKEELI